MNSFLDNRTATGTATVVKSGTGFQSLFSREATTTKSEAGFQPLPATAPKAETEAIPHIELVENAGKVEKIIITCTCCNKIELQCQY
jgi:hypothetical protein